MAHSSAAMKRLGCTPADLLNTCFLPNAEGYIKSSEYMMFWAQMSDEKSVTSFLVTMLQRLTLKLEKKCEANVSVESLCQTISFLITQHKFKGKDRQIKKWREQWKIDDALRDAARAYPCVREVVRQLTLAAEEMETVGPLLIGCSTLHNVQDFHKLSNIVKYPTMPDADIPSGEASFYFNALMARARDVDTPEVLQEVLTGTVNKMLTLPQQMKMNPKVAETTLLALLHMLRNFLAVTSVKDQAFLRRTMSTIQQFYLWPCPYGTVARDTLQTLQREMRAPGAAVRERLLAERNTALYKTGKKTGDTALFWLWDQACHNSNVITEIVNLRPFQASESNLDRTTATFTELALVMNMMNNDLELQDEDADKIMALGASQVRTLFDMAMSLLEQIEQLPDQAREIRTKGLQAMLSKVRKLSKGKQEGTVTARFDEDYHAGAVPPLPGMVHLDLKTRLGWAPPLSREEVALSCTQFFPVPVTPLFARMKEALQMYQKERPETVRWCVAGGDQLLHNVLCSYLQLRQAHPELLDGSLMQFFLLPTGANHLSAFLARHDSWYNRHVYIPMRSDKFVLPWLKRDPHSKLEDNEECNPTGALYRGLTESYVRHAKNTVGVHVYKVEGWRFFVEEGSNEACDQVIPFLQRVELGMLAAAEHFREQKKMGDDIAVQAILSNNNFKFAPPEMAVQFTKMDLRGDTKQADAGDVATYSSVLVANVPRTEDNAFPPDPCAPHLEMFAQTENKGNKKNALSSDPRQHIDSCIITSKDPKKPFTVLVDGKTFGPYFQIRVSQMVGRDILNTQGDEPVKFPVQTFFPLDI